MPWGWAFILLLNVKNKVMNSSYRYGIFCGKACQERKDRELALKEQELDIYGNLINKPDTSNSLIILLPIAIVLIGGIVAIAIIKSRKGK